MCSQQGGRGRFSGLLGTTTLRLPPEFADPPGRLRYERLVFGHDGQLIVALNEWYRLMYGVGAARTRDTCLAVLRPWFGYLTEHGYEWNARPEAVREYTRLFLIEAGCALQRGRVDGWFIQPTNHSPISSNRLHLFIAALRSFYTVMRQGVFDSEDQRFHTLYAYDNPMYSPVLVAWRAEHRKLVRNSGAPDYAGIRSESRADSACQRVGFFQVKRQPLEPPVARDAERTRLAILADVRYMIDHAAPREAVILRMLLESGARVSEVLALTAGGVRRAQNPKIGIDVRALVRNTGEQIESKAIWCSAETREQLRRYIARERSRLDAEVRTRLEDIDDSSPIFLSRRRRQLGYSGFGSMFKRLLRNAQRHFVSVATDSDSARLVLPTITPHTIGHLHTTFGSRKCESCFRRRSNVYLIGHAIAGLWPRAGRIASLMPSTSARWVSIHFGENSASSRARSRELASGFCMAASTHASRLTSCSGPDCCSQESTTPLARVRRNPSRCISRHPCRRHTRGRAQSRDDRVCSTASCAKLRVEYPAGFSGLSLWPEPRWSKQITRYSAAK